MEHFEGGSLQELLSHYHHFCEDEAQFCAAEIILAVNFLHQCGIVHRLDFFVFMLLCNWNDCKHISIIFVFSRVDHICNIYTVGFRFAMFYVMTIHFSTLVELDGALPTCCASLSWLKASFLYIVRFWLFSDVHVFFLFLFQWSSIKLIVIFPPMMPIKKTEKKNR
jgi:hypothetical protein